jgi:hypothetical protein
MSHSCDVLPSQLVHPRQQADRRSFQLVELADGGRDGRGRAERASGRWHRHLDASRRHGRTRRRLVDARLQLKLLELVLHLLMLLVQVARAARLQLGEDFGEEAWLGVDAQHAARETRNNVQATVPEALFAVLDEEGFEGIRDFVAHVGVGEV